MPKPGQRPRSKPKRSTAPRRPQEQGPRFKWIGVKEADTARLGKQFFKLETAASATERLIKGNDRVISLVAHAELGPADLTAFTFELVGERPHQYLFRLRVGNARRKQATFCYTVARSDGSHSEATAAEFEHLRLLHKRAGKQVVQPLRAGTVYLPDRYRRADHGREVAMYLTAWPGAMSPLDGNERGQFVLCEEGRQALSLRDTEALKGMLCEALAASYAPDLRDMMMAPDLAAGDLLAARSQKGSLRLCIRGCRGMVRGVGAGRFVENLVLSRCKAGGITFTLAPEEPEHLFQAIAKVHGKVAARRWVREYADQVASNRLRCTGEDYLEALVEAAG